MPVPAEPAWTFSLTREDILARKALRDEVEAQITALQIKLGEHDKYLAALALILPPEFLDGLVPSVASSDEGTAEHRSIWKAAIETAFQDQRQGFLPREIATFIREHGSADVRERIARNSNGLYAPLSRMVNDGLLVKHGEKFYRPDVYAELEARGELEEDNAEDRLSGSSLLVYNGLNTFGPMEPKRIIDLMREDAPTAAKIANNHQYPYKVIQRLAFRGYIKKGLDGRYRLPAPQENGAPDVSPSNAPDAGSGEDIFS